MPMQRHTQNSTISQPLLLRNLSPSHANKPPTTISPHPKRRRTIGESSRKDEAGGLWLGRSSVASDGVVLGEVSAASDTRRLSRLPRTPPASPISATISFVCAERFRSGLY